MRLQLEEAFLDRRPVRDKPLMQRQHLLSLDSSVEDIKIS